MFKTTINILPRNAFNQGSMLILKNNTNNMNNIIKTFSSTPSSSTTPEREHKDWKALQFKNIAVVGTGVVCVYGVSTLVWDLMLGFLTLTPYSAMKYGFLTGTLSTGGCAAMALYGYSSVTIDPSWAIKDAMSILNHSESARSLLGGSIHQVGKASFKYDVALGGYTIENSSLVYKKPSLKMVFNVSGPSKKVGVCVLEAHKNGLKIEIINQILKAKSGTEVVIRGDANSLNFEEEVI